MKTTIENGVTVLTANEGMRLTNGGTFASTVRLGVHANADDWQEITEAEAEQRMAEMEAAEEATTEDYQAALAEMGVMLDGD